MYDSIIKFPEQLLFDAKVFNGPVSFSRGKVVVGGMGGSALSPNLLKIFDPTVDIIVHRSYGLPPIKKEILAESFLIASSYSGNTEETIDFLDSALKAGIKPAVIATGGTLLERAEKEKLPFIKIPDNVIQPRVAVGLSLVALATLLLRTDVIEELKRIAGVLVPLEEEQEGKRIAEELKGFVPLIYSSSENEAIAYNWKIKINETAKTPSFCSVFPELNHNEMAGFTKNANAPRVSYKALMIASDLDHERVKDRMRVTGEMLSEFGIPTCTTALSGVSPLERASRSLVVADWVAYYLAELYGMNPDDNPTVTEFKKRIAE